MVNNLSEQNSIANHFVMELRDKSIQQDRMRFRKNMERLGELMAFEISKQLKYSRQTIDTPLGRTELPVLAQQPVLITVLRAGLAYFQGFVNFFDKADSGFIGAYRQEVEGSGSSDGRELQTSPYPFDWCFIGAPEQNPHTPHEKVHKDDVKSMITLYTYLMKEL